MNNEKTILTNKLKQYIKDYYHDLTGIMFSIIDDDSKTLQHKQVKISENEFLVDEPFNVKLFKLIDASGKSDVEIYKKAGIDRRHFSKIKSSSEYVPHKKTIMAFVIALELPIEEAELLLDSAGYSLSRSYLFDVILKFFITEGIYNIDLINEYLIEYDQPLIGY